MTDPKRLLDEGASDFEASLLRAGRADVPGGSARRHALAALGLLGTVVGATSTAASAASGAAAGVGAASGGAAAGGATAGGTAAGGAAASSAAAGVAAAGSTAGNVAAGGVAAGGVAAGGVAAGGVAGGATAGGLATAGATTATVAGKGVVAATAAKGAAAALAAGKGSTALALLGSGVAKWVVIGVTGSAFALGTAHEMRTIASAPTVEATTAQAPAQSIATLKPASKTPPRAHSLGDAAARAPSADDEAPARAEAPAPLEAPAPVEAPTPAEASAQAAALAPTTLDSPPATTNQPPAALAAPLPPPPATPHEATSTKLEGAGGAPRRAEASAGDRAARPKEATLAAAGPARGEAPLRILPETVGAAVATGAPALGPRAGVTPLGSPLSPTAPTRPERAAAPGAGGPSEGAPKAAPSAPALSSLSLEAASVEAARRALQGGDAARALGLLDQLQREFPQGQLAPEALMVRLDAMVLRGDRAGAAALARRRLAAQPNGPYAARLRAFTGEKAAP